MNRLHRLALLSSDYQEFMREIRKWYTRYTRKAPEIKTWKLNDYQLYYNMVKEGVE